MKVMSCVFTSCIFLQERKIGEREREKEKKRKKQQRKTDGNDIVVSILECRSCHICSQAEIPSVTCFLLCFFVVAFFVIFVGLSLSANSDWLLPKARSL